MVQNKSLGNVQSISFDIKKPIPIECTRLDLEKISVFLGQNASGKSFYMKNVFALSLIANSILLNKGGPASKDYCQFVLEGCFEDFDTDGKIGVEFESGASISILIKEGKVDIVEHLDFENINQATIPQFMSADMRTFTAMHSYLALRKSFDSLPQENIVSEMYKSYRLYDIMYIERLISKMPFEITPEIKEGFEEFGITEKIISIHVDTQNANFYAKFQDDINTKKLSRFSNGQQALINMFLGNS